MFLRRRKRKKPRIAAIRRTPSGTPIAGPRTLALGPEDVGLGFGPVVVVAEEGDEAVGAGVCEAVCVAAKAASVAGPV